MAHIVTLNTPLREDWLAQLADVVTNPDELLHLLQIEADENLRAGQDAGRLFALRVPRAFIARMEKGNPDDPLLRQVLTSGMNLLSPRFLHRPAGRATQRGAGIIA